MRLRAVGRICVLAGWLLTSAGRGLAPPATTTNPGPHLAFVAPPTDATLRSPMLTVRFSLTNFRLVSTKSGDAVDSGQIELFVDGNPQPALTSLSVTVQLEDGQNQLRAVLIRNGKPLPGTTVTERLNTSLPFVTTTQQFQMLNASWGWKDGQLPNGNLWIATTSDGGKNWTKLPVPPCSEAYSGVFFLNPSDGWIQTNKTVTGTTQGTIVTYRTTDGGHTWTSTSSPAPSWVASGFGGIGGLLFVNATDGWFTAFADAAGQGIVAIYRTRDGGRTWSRISVGNSLGTSGGLPASTPHALPPLGGGLTVALSPSVAFAAGAPYGMPTPLDLYRTVDGGATWQPVSISLPPGIPVSSLGGTSISPPIFGGRSGSLVMTLMPNSGDWQYAMYTTANSGQSWQFAGFVPGTPAVGPPQPLVSFGSALSGIALSSDGLFQTTDGGRNWTRLRPSWLPGLMHSLPNVAGVQVVGSILFALVQGPFMANGAAATVERYSLSSVSATP